MQLEEFQLLFTIESIVQTPITLADVFGCKAHIEKLQMQHLQKELLFDNVLKQSRRQSPKKIPVKVIKVKDTHVLDEFMSNRPIPIKPVNQSVKSPKKQSLMKQSPKKQSPVKRSAKKLNTLTPPKQQEQKIQITIDLPELADPKTPKLMIQDIQQDLGALLHKMKLPRD